MSQILKTMGATITPGDVNSRFAYMVDSQNPETVISSELRAFLEEMGYSSLFPNFDNLRVGNVHPFAILLSQMVFDRPQNTSVFPSITVADSSSEETEDTLAYEYSEVSFDAEKVATFEGMREAKAVFIADPAWDLVKATVESQGFCVGVMRTYTTTHSMDLNIWSENKEVTSFLFDMVGQFITQKRDYMHTTYDIDLGGMSGRRSGDINLDFGMLLYGGNVSVRANMDHHSISFDTTLTEIGSIDVTTLPEYHTTLDIQPE